MSLLAEENFFSKGADGLPIYFFEIRRGGGMLGVTSAFPATVRLGEYCEQTSGQNGAERLKEQHFEKFPCNEPRNRTR
jgi:hypothetical protein